MAGPTVADRTRPNLRIAEPGAMTVMSSRSRWTLIVGLIVVVAAGGAAYWWWTRLPGPGSPLYEAYVREFQVGAAALISPFTKHVALNKLDKAIELIPEEPAAWANRGLVHLRDNQFKE